MVVYLNMLKLILFDEFYWMTHALTSTIEALEKDMKYVQS